jgi:hypothetical protein
MTKQLSNQKAEAKSDVKGASPAFSVASQRSRADDLAVLARNEKFIREAYRLAEIKEFLVGWRASMTTELSPTRRQELPIEAQTRSADPLKSSHKHFPICIASFTTSMRLATSSW